MHFMEKSHPDEDGEPAEKETKADGEYRFGAQSCTEHEGADEDEYADEGDEYQHALPVRQRGV